MWLIDVRARRQEAGYTLAEMLAALVIVGLTMEGVFQAGDLLERQQRKAISTSRSLDGDRVTSARFQDLLNAYQPVQPDGSDLRGDENGFDFACGQQTCGAHLERAEKGEFLRLNFPRPEAHPLDPTDAQFVYVAEAGESGSWPRSSTRPERLRAVLLVAGRSASHPLAAARIWRQEPPGCRFDTVSRSCRAGS